MKLFSVVLGLLFSFSVFALDTIEIMAPSTSLQAGQYHQFKVYFHGDNGTIDVTNKTTFTGTNWSPRANGELLVQPATYGRPMSVTLGATYLHTDGNTLKTTATFNVDSTPYYINIFGPSMVYSNSGAQYQAFAQFRDMRKDISFECSWSAFYGFVSAGGFYRTPYNNNYTMNDTINCRYGYSTQMFNISILR